jgi:hypothetical protein
MTLYEIGLPDPEQFHIKEIGDKILIHRKEAGVKWNDNNKYFRSSLWDKASGKLISAGFRAFVNYGEQPDFEPLEANNRITAVTKMDGCCDENTILYTKDGEKTIKEICESEYFGKVKGYCHKTDNEIWVDVLAHSIKTNLNNWYELELENGRIIKLTGNHKVWLPELQCYRAVENLSGDEIFLLKK